MSFGFYSSYVALWIWVIFQGFLALAIFRQVLELEKRSGKWKGATGGESLVGTRAPKFSGADFHSGQPININLFDGRGGVILFLTAHCSVCRQLARSLQAALLESLPPIVAVCTGDKKGKVKIGNRLGPQIPLLLDGAENLASLYKISGYPMAVVVDGQRMIRAHSGVNNVEDLERLVVLTTVGNTNNGKRAMTIASSGQSA
jgi:peroxiredoxin